MTAKTNMIRLSAAVAGVARVATVDCSLVTGVDATALNEVCAEHIGVNADKTKLSGELPLIRGYAQGGAARKSLGSELIDPKEAGGAALVELLETTILLTLSDLMAEKKKMT